MSYRVYDIEYNDLCVTHTHVDVLIRSVCILNDDLNRLQSIDDKDQKLFTMICDHDLHMKYIYEMTLYLQSSTIIRFNIELQYSIYNDQPQYMNYIAYTRSLYIIYLITSDSSHDFKKL